jgi:hypothetical protein
MSRSLVVAAVVWTLFCINRVAGVLLAFADWGPSYVPRPHGITIGLFFDLGFWGVLWVTGTALLLFFARAYRKPHDRQGVAVSKAAKEA